MLETLSSMITLESSTTTVSDAENANSLQCKFCLLTVEKLLRVRKDVKMSVQHCLWEPVWTT